MLTHLHPHSTTVLDVIQSTPGVRNSQVVQMLAHLKRADVEDAIWDLYSRGMIQIDPDSTMRVPRDGEKIFRHEAP